MKKSKKSITASKLREDVYRILDEIIRSGIPVEIKRNGHKLKIVPEEPENKLKNLKKRPYLKVSPDAIIHLDWSKEWKPYDLS
ncbi:MAG: hypothetical protein MRK01_05235 [Candidatus Scalindua sp.]|nr:hypothetical protein [Candidatus Scalindua sp.]